MRILVVDDDPIILDLLADTLTEGQGYHLDMHTSAEAGLEALNASKDPFDCILLDIMLPGIDGIQMCQKLRESTRFCSTPILMITSSGEVGLMARAFEAGATDFINKPFSPDELSARVAMAGLLNQSLAKAQHTMSTLSDQIRLRFEEAIDLETDGLSSALAIENELLRNRSECFAMSMFSINIVGLRGIYRSVRAPAFRRVLETAAAAAVTVLEDRHFKLAYVGQGRFVGVILGRGRVDYDDLSARFENRLREIWQTVPTGVPVAPDFAIAAISSQRFWSGMSASDTLRRYLSAGANPQVLSSNEENDLFARLDRKLSETT